MHACSAVSGDSIKQIGDACTAVNPSCRMGFILNEHTCIMIFHSEKYNEEFTQDEISDSHAAV